MKLAKELVSPRNKLCTKPIRDREALDREASSHCLDGNLGAIVLDIVVYAAQGSTQAWRQVLRLDENETEGAKVVSILGNAGVGKTCMIRDAAAHEEVIRWFVCGVHRRIE